MKSTTEPVHFEHPQELLRYLYADLTRISQVVSPNIILHPYDASLANLHGITAVQAHEEALVAATGSTLSMSVESILVSSVFGVVSGTMRARRPGSEDLEAGFRGLWRFEDGIPVEHWEAITGDAQKVARWFMDAN
ncbi:hypothetical protein F5Y12DRAFT_270575 [Xylaria sp. FL1777]|nr:hypothetical protein F5Y12DRAFT_270575 [Xylaria sp. FL1777]